MRSGVWEGGRLVLARTRLDHQFGTPSLVNMLRALKGKDIMRCQIHGRTEKLPKLGDYEVLAEALTLTCCSIANIITS